MVEAGAKFVQSLRCYVTEGFFLVIGIAEAFTLHLRGGGGESPGTYLVHIKKLECLSQRYPFGSGLQELNLRRHLPKHRIQTHFAERSWGNRALGEDYRTSRKRQALHHPHQLLSVYDE